MNCSGKRGGPERCFFFCQSNNWNFSSLKAPMYQFLPIFFQIQTFFTGESDRVVVDAQGHSDFCRLREGTYDVKTLPACGLTEQDRLSTMIHCINNNCTIVPKGSYKKNTLGEVHINEAFRGLDIDCVPDLKCWQHLRNIQQPEKRALAAREEDIFNDDFLDCVDDCCGKCEWTIKSDEVNKTVVVLRNNLWPGFFAYARAKTNIFGCVYIGDGLRNSDMCFML